MGDVLRVLSLSGNNEGKIWVFLTNCSRDRRNRQEISDVTMYVGAAAARNTNIVISPRTRSISPAFMLPPVNLPVEKSEGVSFTSGKRWILKQFKCPLEKRRFVGSW